MNAQLFKRLETCDAEQSWEHVRDVIAIQLFGENVFPVPFLGSAASFDIGHVVLKGRRSALEKLTGVLSSALPAGQLSNFVIDDPGRDLMQRLGNVRKDPDTQLNQAYELHESDARHGVKKSITVQLWGSEKWALDYVPKPGDLSVDLGKKGYVKLERIFLITEVFYVNEVRIHVTVGDQEDNYVIKGRIPIGFTLVKYKLQDWKVLGASNRVTTSGWRAKWIKNFQRQPDDPLPFDPFQAKKS